MGGEKGILRNSLQHLKKKNVPKRQRCLSSARTQGTTALDAIFPRIKTKATVM